MIIAVTNRKGGTGKTTLSLHLAAYAAEKELRTLMVDLDPQGSLTFAARGFDMSPAPAVAQVSMLGLTEAEPLASLYGADLLCASDAVVSGETSALDALRELGQKYDVVVLDTPPTAGKMQSLGLRAAKKLVFPVEPDVFATHGLSSLYSDMKATGAEMFIVVNRLRGVCAEQIATAEEIESAVGGQFAGILHEREAVRKARDRGVPVWRYAPAAREWLDVCQRIIGG